MDKKNMDRNLKYNRNEKRVAGTDESIRPKEMGREKSVEDTTKYGEFISSFDRWLPIEKQKKQVQDMENMTKKD